MFLKNLSRLFRTIGVRLAIWYSGVIILSIIVLFFLTYFFLSASLETRDIQEIQSEINELSNEIESEGIEGLKTFVEYHLSNRLKHLLFIRLSDTGNRTLYTYCPFSIDRYNISSLEKKQPIDEQWLSLKGMKRNDSINIKTQFLSNGRILQLGMTSLRREQDKTHFRRLYLFWMIPLIMTGIIIGVFFSIRTLKPLRGIINTVESIHVGKMDSRVPRTGTGDELDELARLFNTMLDRINDLILGMKQSLDNVAHDLRTPLTHIRNMCEASLVSLPMASPSRETHENVLEESDRILLLLDSLMDISEAEYGVMSLVKTEKPLISVIYPVFDLYQMVAETKHIDLIMDIPDDLIVYADPQRLSQVLANLLDNAIKFTPHKGKVFIDASGQDDVLTISIHDTGPGIPEHDVNRIWDRLFRSDQSRSEKGLGLGLCLVKAVIQAHEGSISVKTGPGGTKFIIHLPLRPH